MSSPHDPSALTVNLAAVPSRGARIAISADGERLRPRFGAGFGEEVEAASGLAPGLGPGLAPGLGNAEFEIEGKLDLRGRLDRLDREGFRLLARLAAGLRLECVRCLGPVTLRVEEDLDLVYLPRASERASQAAGGERALDASDMNVSFYDEDRLELAHTIWEQLHLALPVKPLCREGCLGLCSSCGADRNREPRCGCDEAAVPSGRGGLGALRELAGLSPPG